MIEEITHALGAYSAVDVLLSALDFVLVYVLIYQLLVLIRGTKAVAVLVGLLLLIVFYFISKDEYLGLATLHWLLDKFIGSFILVVVVLFQADIRRALATFARTSLFQTMTAQEGAQLVEELVRSCTLLARSRVGALIAIEREGDLSQYTEEGVKLDAAVTNELLFAIFNPGNANPLHDGATVVRNGRIAAAGCFLPLTANPRVDKALGTRHRAAIGLTEDTDAAVLIVSEETGVISLALGGRLSRNLDAAALRQLLHAILGAKRTPTAGRAKGAPEAS